MDYSSGDFEAYTYDEWGNRLTKETPETFIDYEYDEDLLIRAGDVYYNYDDEGYLSERISSKGVETFTFDDTLLSNVTRENGATSFFYDENRKRTGKSGNPDVSFLPMPAEIFGLMDRVRNPLVIDDHPHYFCYGQGLLASAHPEGTQYYLHSHPDGSIGALMNDELMALLEFDPFGVPKDRISPIGFNGEWFDFETGLYYLDHRYYDPTIGRYISPDSIDDHPYIYCYNDPINYIDPLGLWKWGRAGTNSDMMGRGTPRGGPKENKPSSPPPPPPSRPNPFNSNTSTHGTKKKSKKKSTPPPQQVNQPTPSSQTKEEKVQQPYVKLHAQGPQVKEKPPISKDEAAKHGQSTQPTEKSKGHVMTEVGLSDGTSRCSGIYLGEKEPINDNLRAQEERTKSITWAVTEEQAQAAMRKQGEDSHYNLVTHNCADRAREVLQAGGIDVPSKDGTISLPSKVTQWIDHQNNIKEQKESK